MTTKLVTLTIPKEDTECITKALENNFKYRQWDNTYKIDFDDGSTFSIRLWGVNSHDFDNENISPGVIITFDLTNGDGFTSDEEEYFFGLYGYYNKNHDTMYYVFIEPEDPEYKVNIIKNIYWE